MEQKPSAKTGSIGVTRTELAVREELGWLFREQPTEDFGIDAHVEVVDGTSVRGRLLGLQIKSGESFFKEPGPDGWWFRPHQKHIDYWLRHSLPVVVVLYDPETKLCHWQLVTRNTLTESKGGSSKLLVPAAHTLDSSAVKSLRAAAEGEPYELRLRELRLALPWMRRLAEGQRLVVDMEEWINKSSGRGSISIGIDHEDGQDPEQLAQWGVWFGLSDYAEVVPRLLAWADVDVHQETYDLYESEQWRVDFYAGRDWDENSAYEEWRATIPKAGLRPYKNGAGEVDFWRLELTLNRLGLAFLEVDRFATTGERQLVL
jgi:hypothetical protein